MNCLTLENYEEILNLHFEKYEKEIKELLSLPSKLKDFSQEKLRKFEGQTLVMVHIRRGDYIKHPKIHIKISKVDDWNF